MKEIRFGLKPEVIEKIQQVFSKFPAIDEVFIYGSRAKGNFKNGSDIDLTLKGKNLTYKTIGNLNTAIDNLNTPYLFDFSIYENIDNQELREHIERVGLVFYSKHSEKKIK